ncbi:MAG: cobalamin B12-binding domain-containing protein [Deltaproteobacteria bacterium]|nr:cobalamin B12-binding domain-containing protein [Deltaproteobacteria bacterium]
MKILLIQPAQERGLGFRSLAVVEPLGLEAIAGSLPQHNVRILDLRLENHLRQILQDFQPDFCGINCSFTIDVYQTQEIAAAIKAWRKDVPVFVGGHHASLSPSDFYCPSIDGVVVGEGEKTSPEIVQALESGKDLRTIPGIVLNQAARPYYTPERPLIGHLDELPLPARHLTQRYRYHYHLGFQKPFSIMETARGCPYRCDFCSVWKFFQGKCRMKSPQRVLDEIKIIREKFIFLADDNFLLSVPRAKHIAELLMENRVKKHFMFQARSDAIVQHPEVIPLLRRAGFWKVYIGFEKIDEDALGLLNKHNSVQNNEEALKILRAHGMEVIASFIIDPSFQVNDFRRLRQYILDWKLYSPSLTILTPLPGTDLFARVKEKLVTTNYELFDYVHAVLPTKLKLADFYREFTELYKVGYAWSQIGWEGFRAILRNTFSISHLISMKRAAWAAVEPLNYLAGHERKVLS